MATQSQNPPKGGTQRAKKASGIDLVPPHNLAAERGVIAAALLDNETLHDIVTLLKSEDFYRQSHATIFEAIHSMYERNQVVDPITLVEELTSLGEFEKVGGLDAISEILDSVAHAMNARHHAHIVRDNSSKRKILAVVSAVVDQVYSKTRSADELVESLESAAFRISEDRITSEVVGAGEAADETMEYYRNRPHPRDRQRVSTGLEDLDSLIGDLEAGRLIVVGARPSVGKTAIALHIARQAAFVQGASALLVSLEMSRTELTERLLVATTGIPPGLLKNPTEFDEEDSAEITKAIKLFKGSKLFIDDTPHRSVLQISATARRMKSRRGLSLLIVDYIQLMKPENDKDNRQEQIAKISRRLKLLARELKIPIIALAQLNREVDKRDSKNRKPRLSDLRESGAIEADADQVLLMHRPDLYDPSDQPGVVEMIVAKNRHGKTGTARLQFSEQSGRFSEPGVVPGPVPGEVY